MHHRPQLMRWLVDPLHPVRPPAGEQESRLLTSILPGRLAAPMEPSALRGALLTRLDDEDGQFTGRVTASRDVTDRERVTQMLQDSEERLKILLQKMPVMLNAFNEDFVFVFWNEECERVTGYTADEIIGNPSAVELLYPDPAVRDRLFSESAGGFGDFRDREWTLTCKDGTRRTISWSNVAGSVQIPGWYSWAVGVDVTERKAAQAREVEHALEHERAEMLNRFLQDLSHDLRNPLSVISTGMYLIERRLSADAFAQIGDNVERIQRQINQLTAQLDNMVAMTRLYRPDFAYQMEPTDLNRVAQQAVAECRALADRRRQTILVEPAEPPVELVVDARELQRVIENLLANALNFSPEDATVTLRLLADNSEAAVIEVIDHGIGLSIDELPHIFKPFYRADKARSIDTGGNGLGLTLVEKIVSGHHGTITVESEPGAGSTFRVRLPLVQPIG